MLLQTIEQIGREKNIAPEVIIAAIEEAMAVAAQKFYRTEDRLVAKLNPDSGEVDLNSVKTIVEEVEDPLSEITIEEAVAAGMDNPAIGDELRTSMPTEGLGRIAAQAAKQVIFQKVRDAERDNIFNEYQDRIGELLTGSVKRFERGDMVIDLGRAEAVLPRREQSRAEHYNIGDRIRVVVVEVLRDTRGPLVVVSRSSSELLLRLFEMEVPEIYDGTVLVKGAVREGGDRAKVAVHSLDPDIDPVGACVGMRGSRVQGIIRELRGEKIDIVDWAEDPYQFAINALKPAKVNQVTEVVREDADGYEEVHLEVIVDEDQLSLAIGKRGQNVRLAGKLLGRKIDVMSKEQKEGGPAVEPSDAVAESADADETAPADGAAPLDAVRTGDADAGDDLDSIVGVGPKAAAALRDAGYTSAAGIAAAGSDALLAVAGIGPKSALKIWKEAVAVDSGESAAPEAGDEPAAPVVDETPIADDS
jgi:N utilization substance protein A